MTLSVVAAAEMNFQCSDTNCILSNYTSIEKTADYVLNFPLTSGEEDGILAVKFESCELFTIPNGIFINLLSVLCLISSAPGFAAISEDSFQNANSLQFLYLQQNRIERIEAATFVQTPNLNELNLGENRIYEVSSSAFAGLERLECLALYKNDIEFFHAGTFYPLTSLMTLDISSNKIQVLTARSFSRNKFLSNINAANNLIFSIPDDFMNQVPSVNVLNVMNNNCTKSTMLEEIPLIRILDSNHLNSEDEKALRGCYTGYEEHLYDSNSIEDLLERADEVQDDIEGLLIGNLNEELREKDETIRKLQDETNHVAFLALVSAGIAIFVLLAKCARITVEKVYDSQVKKLQEAKAGAEVAAAPEKKDGCYVIEITKH